MKHIYTRFDKHAIPDLPKACFEGRIVVVISRDEAERAVDYLLSQPILGFDTETKPRFKSGGGMNKVALLQVSTPDICFLFRLNQIGFPPCIIRLLSDKNILKIGLSWHDDLMQLHRRAEFEAGTFVELQKLVDVIGIKDLSLQKIYANLFGQKISKTQRLTNWEADVLTPGQQVYAATDAWACIQIYNEIMRLDETKDYELEIVPEPEPPQPAEPKESKEPQDKEVKPRKPRRKRKPSARTTVANDDSTATQPEEKKAQAAKRPRRFYKRKTKKTSTDENIIS